MTGSHLIHLSPKGPINSCQLTDLLTGTQFKATNHQVTIFAGHLFQLTTHWVFFTSGLLRAFSVQMGTVSLCTGLTSLTPLLQCRNGETETQRGTTTYPGS